MRPNRSLLLAFLLTMVSGVAHAQFCPEALEPGSGVTKIDWQRYIGLYSSFERTNPFNDKNLESSLQVLGLSSDPLRDEFTMLFRLHDNVPGDRMPFMSSEQMQAFNDTQNANIEVRRMLYRQTLGPQRIIDILSIAADWAQGDKTGMAMDFFTPFWVQDFFASLAPSPNTSFKPEEITLLLKLKIPSVDWALTKILGSELGLQHPEWFLSLLEQSHEDSWPYRVVADGWTHHYPRITGADNSLTRMFSSTGQGVFSYTKYLLLKSVAIHPEWMAHHPDLVKRLYLEIGISADEAKKILSRTAVGLTLARSLTRDLSEVEVRQPDSLSELITVGSHDLEVVQMANEKNIDLPNEILELLYQRHQKNVLQALNFYVRKHLATVSPQVLSALIENSAFNTWTAETINTVLHRTDSNLHPEWFLNIHRRTNLPISLDQARYLVKYPAFFSPEIYSGQFRWNSFTPDAAVLIYNQILLRADPQTDPQVILNFVKVGLLNRQQLAVLLQLDRWKNDPKINAACGGHGVSVAQLLGENTFMGAARDLIQNMKKLF